MRHTGAEFEAGRVGRPRGGRNGTSPARGRASPARGGGGFAGSAEPLSPAAASAGSTRSSPRITSKITPATPRLFKSFNYRCSWSDGWSNQMLRLDEYGCGDEAEYNSWVILEKAAAVREEAGSS